MFVNDSNDPFRGRRIASRKRNNQAIVKAAQEMQDEALVARGYRRDAANPIAFNVSELEQVDTQIWEDLTQAMLATRFIRMQSLPKGLNKYSWRKVKRFGQAQRRRHLKDTDVNFVDADAERAEHSVLYSTIGYNYSLDEQMANGLISFDYLSELRSTAAEAIARDFDSLFLLGDDIDGRKGLFNNASVPVIDQSELTGTWDSSTTFAQVLDDLKIMFGTIFDSLKDLDMDPAQAASLMPNTIIFPSNTWVSILRKDDGLSEHKTILELINSQLPEIKNVFHSIVLNTADSAGTGQRVVMYNDDPKNVKGLIQTPYEEMPTEQHAFSFRTYAYGSAVGTIFHRPFTALYSDIDVA